MESNYGIVVLENLFICGLGLLFIMGSIATLKDAWVQANIGKRTEKYQAEVVDVRPSRGTRTVKLAFKDSFGKLVETTYVTRRFFRVGDAVTAWCFVDKLESVAVDEHWSVIEYGFTCVLGGLTFVSGVGAIVIGLYRLFAVLM